MVAKTTVRRLDVSPLCITHRVPMVSDYTDEKQSNPELQTYSYHCPSTDCDLNWERRLGYFKTATTKQTFQFGIDGRRCPTAWHSFLYLAESKEHSNRRLWRCPVEDCAYAQPEGGAVGSR
jgi:hypothetical protein